MKYLTAFIGLVLFAGCYTFVETDRVFEKSVSITASQDEIYAALQEWAFARAHTFDVTGSSQVWFNDRELGLILTGVARSLAHDDLISDTGYYKLVFQAQNNQLDIKATFSGSADEIWDLKWGVLIPRTYYYNNALVTMPAMARESALQLIEDEADKVLADVEEFLTERF